VEAEGTTLQEPQIAVVNLRVHRKNKFDRLILKSNNISWAFIFLKYYVKKKKICRKWTEMEKTAV